MAAAKRAVRESIAVRCFALSLYGLRAVGTDLNAKRTCAAYKKLTLIKGRCLHISCSMPPISVNLPHTAQAEHRTLRPAETVPHLAPAIPHANVRRKASAKSGERMPRFFMSASLSTTILPVEVKLYVGAVSSAITASSFGIEHALS